jgi:hypothetical protein
VSDLLLLGRGGWQAVNSRRAPAAMTPSSPTSATKSALLGPREMSNLSPHSEPQRTLISSITNRDFMSTRRNRPALPWPLARPLPTVWLSTFIGPSRTSHLGKGSKANFQNKKRGVGGSIRPGTCRKRRGRSQARECFSNLLRCAAPCQSRSLVT